MITKTKSKTISKTIAGETKRVTKYKFYIKKGLLTVYSSLYIYDSESEAKYAGEHWILINQ